MPSFNHRPFVEASVRSVLGQTYPALELVVVDNDSSDGTYEAVARVKDPRLRLFSYKRKGIIAAVRNFGLRETRGDYVAFIDSDDVWRPEKLARQVEHMESNPRLAGISTNFMPTGEIVHAADHLAFARGEEYRDFDYGAIALENPILTSAMLARTNAVREAGGFDESPDFRFIEDWELWLRLSWLGPVRVLADRLLEYRVVIKPARGLKDIGLRTLKVYEKHHGLRPLEPGLLKAARGNRFIEIGRACLAENDPEGPSYLRRGLLDASGGRNKLRALAALALFALPARARASVVEALYSARGQVLPWPGQPSKTGLA